MGKKVLKSILISFLTLFVLTSCEKHSVNEPNNYDENKEIYADLDRLFNSQLENYDIPGIAVLIDIPDKNIHYEKAFGLAERSTQKPLKVNNLFRIGSVSKTFTITTLLQLVDEGLVSLTDTLSKFYPNYPKSNKVTISMLCNMTSGIPDYIESDSFILWAISNPTGHLDPDQIIEMSKDLNYYFEPGTGYKYSNTNTIIVGRIIEKLTKNTLEAEIKKRIIEKLNLNNTSFPTSRYLWGDYAHGYGTFFENTGSYDVTESYDVSYAWAAGAIVSNVEDLSIWVKSLAQGTLLTAQTHQARKNYVTLVAALDFKYGLGCFDVAGFMGHNGAVPGYLAFAAHSVERNATFVILFNRYFAEETNQTDPTMLFLNASSCIYKDLPWSEASVQKSLKMFQQLNPDNIKLK